MQKNVKSINECRSCKSKKLSSVLSLGNSYLSDFVSNNTKPPKYPLVLLMCRNCYLIQLKHTTPQSLLYTEHYGYKSGINQTMNDELKGIAEASIEKFDSSIRKIFAIDIG